MGMISLLIQCGFFFLNHALDAARSLSSVRDKRRSVRASPHTRELMCATWKSARISNVIIQFMIIESTAIFILDCMCGVPSGTGKQWRGDNLVGRPKSYSGVGRMGHCPIPRLFVEYMGRPVYSIICWASRIGPSSEWFDVKRARGRASRAGTSTKRTEPESSPERVMRMIDIRTSVVLKREEEKEEEKRDSNIMKVLGFQKSDGLLFATPKN